MHVPDELPSRALIALRQAAAQRPLSIFVDPTLADPMQEDDRCRALLDAALGDAKARIVRLPRIHDNFDPQRHPYLIHVTEEFAAERLVEASLHVALSEALGAYGPDQSTRSVCGWLIGESDAGASALRLAQTAHVTKPDGKPWYLRFWDPRVIWHLPRAMTSAHWSQVKQGCGEWFYITVSGELSTVAAAITTATGPACSKPLAFDAQQWRRLERIGPINTVLALAREWEVVSNTASAARIEALFERSAAMGFETEDDLIVFASCALTSHERFDEHPQVLASLRASQRVTHAIGGFSDSFWNDLRDGRWLKSNGRNPA